MELKAAIGNTRIDANESEITITNTDNDTSYRFLTGQSAPLSKCWSSQIGALLLLHIHGEPERPLGRTPA